MLYAKFQDHRTFGSGKEDLYMFYHIWAWRPSWSRDLDHLYILSFSKLHIKFGFDWPRDIRREDV